MADEKRRPIPPDHVKLRTPDPQRIAALEAAIRAVCDEHAFLVVHFTTIDRGDKGYLPWVSANFEQLPQEEEHTTETTPDAPCEFWMPAKDGKLHHFTPPGTWEQLSWGEAVERARTDAELAEALLTLLPLYWEIAPAEPPVAITADQVKAWIEPVLEEALTRFTQAVTRETEGLSHRGTLH